MPSTASVGWILLGSLAAGAGLVLGAEAVEHHTRRRRGYGAVGQLKVTGSGGARVNPRSPWFHSTLPTGEQLGHWGAEPYRPVPVDREWSAVEAAIEACGVPVKTRPLPGEGDELLEGLYQPGVGKAGTILINGSLARDPYGLQTLIHEGTHALLHNVDCLPHPTADHTLQEDQAEAATVWAFSRLGLPLETWEGEVPPDGYQVDPEAMAHYFGQEAFANVKWATDWLVEAAHGQGPGCQLCPAPQDRSHYGAKAGIQPAAPEPVAAEEPLPVDQECTEDNPDPCALTILLGRIQQLGEEAHVNIQPVADLLEKGEATTQQALDAARQVLDQMPAGEIREEAEMWYAAAGEFLERANPPEVQGEEAADAVPALEPV